MASDDWEAVYASIQDSDAEAFGLRLLTITASRDKVKIQQHLNPVQGGLGTLGRGARLCALVDLEQFGQVFAFRDNTLPTGDSPFEWFDACNAAFAVGIAAGMLGKAELSYAQLWAARTLACGLGMKHREQLIGIELESMRTVLGDPSPVRIRQAMAMAPMTARRTHRSGIAIAEAHMALGDYTAAMSDAPEGSDLQAFLQALLFRDTAELPVASLGDYAPLALALRGQMVALPTPTTEPEAGYEILTRAFLLTRSPVTAGQAAAILAARRPRLPDQRLLWAALMWTALTEGATGGLHPTVILEELAAALDALAKLEDVAQVLRQLLPQAFALFAFMPDAPPIFTTRLMDIPLLTGNHLMYQGQAFKLPGRAGASYVAAAARGERNRKMHPEEKARYTRELAELPLPCEPVNLGWVARALATMMNATSGSEAERWRSHGLNLCESLSGHEGVAACRQLFT